MQIFNEICANLHTFLVQKSEHWIKSVSIFFDILVKSFYICHSIIQKILYFHNFGGIKMLYIIKQMIYEQIRL